jgi:hypothetical protein
MRIACEGSSPYFGTFHSFESNTVLTEPGWSHAKARGREELTLLKNQASALQWRGKLSALFCEYPRIKNAVGLSAGVYFAAFATSCEKGRVRPRNGSRGVTENAENA